MTPKTIRSEVRRCREIQLAISMFNETYSAAVYSYKLMALGMVIPGLGFALKFNITNPLISLNNALYGIYVSFFYTLVYDKAFQIPVRLDKVNKRILATATKISAGFEGAFGKEVKLAVRSVPTTGIRVGNFEYMQRQSTPTTVDFIGSRTCSLLLTLNEHSRV